jgi:hypothetical protein
MAEKKAYIKTVPKKISPQKRISFPKKGKSFPKNKKFS